SSSSTPWTRCLPSGGNIRTRSARRRPSPTVSRPAVQAFVCCLVWVVACLVVVVPASSAGVIYKYEDERGITHYTDRRDLIPDKFRSKAQVVDSANAPVTVVSTAPPSPSAPGARLPSWTSWVGQF